MGRSDHTFRHSFTRHLLMHGIPINYLSRWLGHSSIQTTLIYLELVPDPTGSLDRCRELLEKCGLVKYCTQKITGCPTTEWFNRSWKEDPDPESGDM